MSVMLNKILALHPARPTLIIGSMRSTTMGVTTNSLADKKGFNSQSRTAFRGSIGKPVSSHASLLAVASKSASPISYLPPGIAVSPPCDRNPLERCDNITYSSPLRLPKMPSNTAALRKAGTASGHGSGVGTWEAKFRSAERDSSVRGPSSGDSEMAGRGSLEDRCGIAIGSARDSLTLCCSEYVLRPGRWMPV